MTCDPNWELHKSWRYRQPYINCVPMVISMHPFGKARVLIFWRLELVQLQLTYIKIGTCAVFIPYVKYHVHAKDSCLVIGSNIVGNVYLVSLAQHLSMTPSTVELLKSLYRSPPLETSWVDVFGFETHVSRKGAYFNRIRACRSSAYGLQFIIYLDAC